MNILLHLKNCISEQIVMSSEVVNDIADYFNLENLKAGDHFTEPGKACKKMAFISSGALGSN